MKLILKEYLSSLKERGELDAILPDLLSQMGLNVIGTPTRGVKEYGVDISAVGSIDGKEEKLYLLSVKEGDLTRTTWTGSSDQALRPSLEEILDSYIPARIPPEHKDKPIEICLCFGGEVKTVIRQDVSGFTNRNTRENITFSEWNGDKIADFILCYFLNEELAPEEYQRLLRKSLSMIEEPEVAFNFYKQLVDKLCEQDISDKKLAINVLRQLNIYTWILYAWARELNNIESAYLASEYVLLKSWDIFKEHREKKGKNTEKLAQLINAVQGLHVGVSEYYIEKVIQPSCGVYLGLSSIIAPSCPVDVNLKLFDTLGRVAIQGILYAQLYQLHKEHGETQEIAEQLLSHYHKVANQLISVIENNRMLFTPYKDDQAIDIVLAVFCLLSCNQYTEFVENWLTNMTNLIYINFRNKHHYPINESDYERLINHPIDMSDEYRESVTAGSILVPYLALIASLLKSSELYQSVQKLKNDFLSHSTHQIYFFDEYSEKNLYGNHEIHGAILSDVNLDQEPESLLKEIREECELSNNFNELSAVKAGLYPIVLIACRHYRLPFPINMLFWQNNQKNEKLSTD